MPATVKTSAEQRVLRAARAWHKADRALSTAMTRTLASQVDIRFCSIEELRRRRTLGLAIEMLDKP